MNSRMQLRRYETQDALFADSGFNREPQTPSEWFSQKFPRLTCIYGTPLMEEAYTVLQQGMEMTRIRPAAVNTDFFAAILKGNPRLGHQVVYYLPEQKFYFFDPREDCFVPTLESKLEGLLSQYLLRCAEAMNGDVDIAPLFNEFRSHEQLKQIIVKAKSILAANDSFFTGAHGHKRKLEDVVVDPAAEPAYKLFVHDSFVAEPNQILTLNDAYENFSRYCHNHGFKPEERRTFKGLITEVVREALGLGLRHDLKVNGGKATQGWKGIACNLPVLEGADPRN